MTSGVPVPGLTLKHRHPVWLRRYPPNFWLPWHMSLQGHGQVPQEHPVSSMQALYRTDRIDTPAARHLLSFEARTLLPRLPASTGVTRTLLLGLAGDVLNPVYQPEDFWLRLPQHFEKHVEQGDSHPYLLAAARASLAYLKDTVRLPPLELQRLDPGEVSTPREYALLAGILLLTSLDEGRPFGFSLYCPRPVNDFRPATGLVLNIRVPSPFMQLGTLPARDVLVGVALATAEEVVLGGGIYVPEFVPEQMFTTLFAPDQRTSAAMLKAGRGTHLFVS
ncbi:hypothetical protein DEIPH_ctg139orf0146 [Deinococcus phoenicis]|uniref:Uncharacterized protein n=1 Tax=Deinococcus phoenicis TaxID=1476583 RepID=A0A016QKK3_9DEIO|nr:hypothetical protein [Deinococcus phoenicis]EYB66417.1 hypothetical protein DEIPH_ctg139orf0146 [Deinococcus phoenicis]